MRWIRPFITVALVGGVTTGFIQGKIDATAYFGFATGLVVYWFKSRDDDKNNPPPGATHGGILP